MRVATRNRLRSTLLVVLALGSAAPDRALAADAASAAGEVRLSEDVRPTFQAVRLHLDPSQERYSGSVRIELQVRRPTESLRFHAQEMELRRLSLEGGGRTIALTAGPEERGLVAAKSGSVIPSGNYTLTIDFTNDFDRRAASLFRLESEGRWYAFTQFEAIDARKAFPCWDEPSFKFPWQVTLSIPAGQEAVSNTPVEADSVVQGTRTITFAKTKPLPSYLIAVAVGPLDFVPMPGLRVPGRVVVPKGKGPLAKTAVAMTPPLFAALERYFGMPYPYEKLDLIAVPEFSPGAMENPGAITYADRFLLFDERTMSARNRSTFAAFTAHEIAHQWFGNYVTMKWWDDLWLNESFAEWLGNKIADEVFPAYRIRLDALTTINNAFNLDAQLATHAIRRPVHTMENLYEAADALAYDKGQSVLGMTERWVGPEVFRKGVVAYLKAHAFGNAEGKDLWNSLGNESGKDVPGVLASFLDQPGAPLVSLKVGKNGTVDLEQRRFLNYGVRAPEQRWKIPVTLMWQAKGTPQSLQVLLDRDRMTVRLPGGARPAWVHPNADEVGYYRWSVDPASLERLVAEAPTALTAAERIGFIQNAAALLESGVIHGDQYLRVLAGFSGDTNPIVIAALGDGLTLVKNALVSEEDEEAFAGYVRAVLGPALRRFGLDRAPDEDEGISLVRPTLYAWLGDEGRDAEVRHRARALARSFLRDRGSIDPSLVGNALRIAAIDADSTLFDTYRQRFEAATAPTDRESYLRALGSFRDPALRRRALAYGLSPALRPQEVFWIPEEMRRVTSQQDEVWSWWETNYETLVGKMPPEYAMFIPLMGSGCSETRLRQMEAFFADARRVKAGTKTTFDKVTESTRDCFALRAREGAAAMRAVQELARAR